MAKVRSRLPLQVAGIYLLIALAWTILSDLPLQLVGPDVVQSLRLHLWRELLFVVVTGGALFVLLRALVRRTEEAESNLRAQEERWKLALQSVGDGLWEADLSTNRHYYSPGWKSMLGYADHEINPSPEEWRALIHPEDWPFVSAAMADYLEKRTPAYRVEFRMRAKDGSYRWILSRGSLVADPAEPGHRRMIGTHTDITASKRNEAMTVDTLAFMGAVLRISPAGIMAFRSDGAVLIANESAARILGTEALELTKFNFRADELWRRSGLLAAAERALASDREVAHSGRFTTGAGQDMWIAAHLVPFMHGGHKHLLVLLNDDTGKHRTLDNLHLMEAAAQAAPVGWVVTDARGRIEWVNPAFTALTGYAAAEVIGQNPRLLKSGHHSPEFYRAMWDSIRRGQIWTGEVVNRRKDGSIYHEFSTIAPIAGDNGEVTHFVAIKQDITERKQLEQQLSRAQRLESIGLLACGMAHDLNNMLSPIMLSLGLIRDKYRDHETASHVRIMESAAQRGAGILRQVLTFAQGVDGERVGLEPKHLVKEMGQLAQETFPRQIKVVVRVSPTVSQVLGDLTQLHQVLLNLAVNARDAMPSGGVLTLEAADTVVDEARAARQVMAAQAGPYVCFTVSDTGSGISPEVLERMFDPFFTTKPRGKGTGLGLSTVFGIVRSHGGFIEVASEVGAGTRISVLLPAVARPSTASEETVRPVTQLAGNGRRILVVDDEEMIRSLTSRLLVKRGFRVAQAPDGAEALRLFGAAPGDFAAVITDLMMPVMNGYQFIREARRFSTAVPILASSGLASESPSENVLQQLRELGVQTLLRKPYSEEEFFAALRVELERAAEPAARAPA